jgi:hypothetical protein
VRAVPERPRPSAFHLAGLSPTRTLVPNGDLGNDAFGAAHYREISVAQAMAVIPFGHTSSSRISQVLGSQRGGDMAVAPISASSDPHSN